MEDSTTIGEPREYDCFKDDKEEMLDAVCVLCDCCQKTT